MILKIFNLELILSQVIFQSLINVEGKGDLLLEIFMQNRYRNFQIFEPFRNIKEEVAENFNVYVNISLIHKLISHSDKFNLNELICYYKNCST